jgi:hypothetical protein
MKQEQIALRRVDGAARRRREAESALRQANAELTRYCGEAREAGVPVATIATTARLSRQGTYDLLRRVGRQAG